MTVSHPVKIILSFLFLFLAHLCIGVWDWDGFTIGIAGISILWKAGLDVLLSSPSIQSTGFDSCANGRCLLESITFKVDFSLFFRTAKAGLACLAFGKVERSL